MTKPLQSKLISWYKKNFRRLPWRESQDPYKIWISEIMLQQTTTTVVKEYYNRFLERFPTVCDLADADIEEVYELWAGLGYYSRARNIHKAAKAFAKTGFPKTWKELIEYPGLGPYTARAVSSFAFGEQTGVLDGNVIRFLSRFHKKKVEWWKASGRQVLQNLADEWSATKNAPTINQALMEIGATICTANNPSCVICPVFKNCNSKGMKNLEELPLKKPKKNQEHWVIQITLPKKGNRVGLIKNDYAPFLKNQLIWPGKAKKLKKPPRVFDFQHAITHHKIYVQIKNEIKISKGNVEWVDRKDLKRRAPSSLVSKALEY